MSIASHRVPHDFVAPQGLDAKHYKGSVDCVIQVVRKEGVLALYRGLGARLGRAVPGQGIIFASYEVFSQQITGGLLWATAKPKGHM